MSEYDVTAVKYGTLPTTRSHVFLNYSEYGQPDGPIELAYYFWVIRSAERTVVVDTGYSRAAGAKRGRTVLVDPPDAFAEQGIGRDFAGTVVLTHAHYDHIGNADYFERAQFLMARAEFDFWTSAAADHPLFRGLVEPAEIQRLRELDASGRVTLIDEDTELAPGIRVVIAPGHTPGQLMLDVATPVGPLLLTSDASHFDEELERDMPFRHMCDLPQSYATFELIRSLRSAGRRIVVGHEPSVPDIYPAAPGAFAIGLSSADPE